MKSILRQMCPAFRLGWSQPKEGQHWSIIVGPQFNVALSSQSEDCHALVARIARRQLLREQKRQSRPSVDYTRRDWIGSPKYGYVSGFSSPSTPWRDSIFLLLTQS